MRIFVQIVLISLDCTKMFLGLFSSSMLIKQQFFSRYQKNEDCDLLIKCMKPNIGFSFLFLNNFQSLFAKTQSLYVTSLWTWEFCSFNNFVVSNTQVVVGQSRLQCETIIPPTVLTITMIHLPDYLQISDYIKRHHNQTTQYLCLQELFIANNIICLFYNEKQSTNKYSISAGLSTTSASCLWIACYL